MLARDTPSEPAARHAISSTRDAGRAVLVRIRAELPRLRPAERRVADAILAAPAQVAQTAITSLAQQCSTSETTVLRFCRAIGVPSYPQLRMALARETSRAEAVHPGTAAMSADISPTDSIDDVIAKVLFADARAIEETELTLDVAQLTLAVDAVCRARRTEIVGVGASAFVGADLHQKLHRIGLTSFSWSDLHSALTSAALMRPGDVAVGISHAGATVDTIEPMQTARDCGATTIAITNVPGSPLAAVADIVLVTASRETTFRSGAMASRIAQLALVDCLFVAVAQRFFDETVVALEKTRLAVDHRRLPYRRTPE